MRIPDDQSRITGDPRRILVLGATGRFGGVADLLLGRGHQVRAGTRDPAHPLAARLAARGAGLVRADFEDVASLAAAARGMDAVFASGTAHRAGPGGEARHGRNLAEALARAGAPHLVFVSGAGAGQPAGLPVLEAKRAVEERIRELGVPTTVIAPVYLMENLFNPWNLGPLRAGVLPSPVPPAMPLQQVATVDILALAVLAAENPAVFTGERIEIASDELTAEQAASVLSGLVGRELVARQLPAAGLPPGLAALFAWLERGQPRVGAAALRERFPGAGWHTFGDWAKEHQARLDELASPSARP